MWRLQLSRVKTMILFKKYFDQDKTAAIKLRARKKNSREKLGYARKHRDADKQDYRIEHNAFQKKTTILRYRQLLPIVFSFYLKNNFDAVKKQFQNRQHCKIYGYNSEEKKMLLDGDWHKMRYFRRI